MGGEEPDVATGSRFTGTSFQARTLHAMTSQPDALAINTHPLKHERRLTAFLQNVSKELGSEVPDGLDAS